MRFRQRRDESLDDEIRDYIERETQQNIEAGTRYLKELLLRYNGDLALTLAAYNAGPGITAEWRRGKPFLETGDIAYPETRRFVKNVERTYVFLKMVQGWKYLFGMAHGR